MEKIKLIIKKIIFTGVDEKTPKSLKAYIVQTNTNGLIYFVLDFLLALVFSILLSDSYVSKLLMFAGVIFLFSSIGLNKLRFYNLSRVSTVTVGSLLVVLCSFYLGKNVLAHASLLLGAIFPFVYFNSRERWQIFVCLLMPIIGFCLLLFLDYDWGPQINIQSKSAQMALEAVFMFVPFFGIVSNTFIAVRAREEVSEELKKSQEHINMLFKVLTHDISTPLGVATMGCELVKRKAHLDDETLKRIDKVYTSLKNTSLIIKKVKHMAMLEGGKAQYQIEAIDLKPLIDSLVEELADQLKEKDITIDIISKNLTNNDLALADKSILKYQVIQNILTNAIKFSEISSKIIICLSSFKDFVTIEIQDYGVGIEKEKLSDLFSWTIATSTKGTNNEMGTGYGMPLAFNFLKVMGGKLDVTSKIATVDDLSSGTKFTITLPIYKEPLQISQKSA
ncbi:MAG: HAMP domain-containing histidine kinase [Bdellovibrionales bacterium]|nr:HAMP domain-containing histidine kinase [Bdellovibrionales bacterium]